MQSKLPMHHSPRCGARTRSGRPCQSPAMANGRCRLHGGLSPGAPKGNRNALKHGRYTAEAVGSRREIVALIRAMKKLLAAADADAWPVGQLGTIDSLQRLASGHTPCRPHPKWRVLRRM